MLCSVCEKLFSHTYWQSEAAQDHFEREDEPKTFLPHQRTIHDLRTSASLSCFVCYRLLQEVLRRHLQLENVTLAPSSYLTVVWTRGRLGPNHKLPFEISSDWKDHLQRDTPRLKLEQFEICPHPARSKQVDREAITSSTDITLNAAIGQQWIDDCIHMHPKCRQSLSKGWHPTRLLDVSDRYRIVLVESKFHNIVGPYTTLSHCWGTAEILKLTRDTYNIFRKGFSVADLPRTFADAVTVAQTFNVQYIWIDSLCIIQDSASDWAREAISMSDVYQNSMCNIGASAASSTDGGLFRARDVELIRFPRIINDKGAHMVTWTRFWGEGVNSAPLYKRGWVVQERWLCPRMLHFGAEQIFWECRSATVCDSLPYFADSSENSQSSKIGEGRRLPANARGLERTGVIGNTWRIPWGSLVHTYSRTALTVQTDKIVAFAGVAKAFSMQHPDDEYLAGLWRANLVAQLPWIAMKTEPYDKYIAPSWS